MIKGNLSIFYVLAASTIEKLLPFIISFIYINRIDPLNFGVYIICFQLSLILSAVITTPVLTHFNNTFFNREHKDEVTLVYPKNILIYLFIFVVIQQIYFKIDFITSIYVVLYALTSSLTVIGFNFLRFKGQNLKYLFLSLLKLAVLIGLFQFTFTQELKVNTLFICLLISNLSSVGFLIYIFNFNKNISLEKHEYYSLVLYGFFTIFFSGVDKLIINSQEINLYYIAVIGYISTIASTNAVYVEGIKKYLSPIYFREFSINNKITKIIFKKAGGYYLLSIFFQFILPFLTVYILTSIELLKQELLVNEFNSLLFFWCLNLCVFNFYHFINPIFFYKLKTNLLVYAMLVSLAFFFIGLHILNKMELFTVLYNVITAKIFASAVLILLVSFPIIYKNGKIL